MDRVPCLTSWYNDERIEDLGHVTWLPRESAVFGQHQWLDDNDDEFVYACVVVEAATARINDPPPFVI